MCCKIWRASNDISRRPGYRPPRSVGGIAGFGDMIFTYQKLCSFVYLESQLDSCETCQIRSECWNGQKRWAKFWTWHAHISRLKELSKTGAIGGWYLDVPGLNKQAKSWHYYPELKYVLSCGRLFSMRSNIGCIFFGPLAMRTQLVCQTEA